MAHIGVARLSVTLPRASLATTARWRAEDALRCAGEDGGSNLVLVRRLSLGLLPGGRGAAEQSTWAARVEARLRDTVGSAMHALAPGAPSAGAVFFSSELEARTALAMLLAAGRHPSAWFWRMAVPEWTGGTWSAAAPVLLRALAMRPGGAPALARLVVRSLDAGHARALLLPVGDSLVQSLAAACGLSGAWASSRSADPRADQPQSPASGPAVTGACRVPADDSVLAAPARLPGIEPPAIDRATMHAAAVAARSVATLSGAAVDALRAELSRRPVASPIAVWLGAQVALAEAPQLAESPVRLAEVARAVTQLLAATPAATDRAPDPTAPPRVPRRDQQALPDHALPAAANAAMPSVPPPARPPAAPLAPADSTPVSWPVERRTAAAGLFLLVRPMALMGLPEWLATRADAIADGFVWALLRAIASRMRVPPEDAVWDALVAGEGDATDVTAWRVGLDVWLRRTAGISLAATVRKPGWLIADEDRIILRFPVDAADIRLRRHALDVNPGWTPWLGRSVWFVYRDLPLLAEAGS